MAIIDNPFLNSPAITLTSKGVINEEAVTLANVVIPVFLNSGNWPAGAASDGSNIHCYVGGVEVQFYKALWDNTNQIATLYVLVPSLLPGITSFAIDTVGSLTSSADLTLSRYPADADVLACWNWENVGAGTTCVSTNGLYAINLSHNAIVHNGDLGGFGPWGSTASPFSTGKHLEFNGTTNFAWIMASVLNFHNLPQFNINFWVIQTVINGSDGGLLCWQRNTNFSWFVLWNGDNGLDASLDTGISDMNAKCVPNGGYFPQSGHGGADTIIRNINFSNGPKYGTRLLVDGFPMRTDFGFAGPFIGPPKSIGTDNAAALIIGARGDNISDYTAPFTSPNLANNFGAFKMGTLTIHSRELDPVEVDQIRWRMPIHPIKCAKNRLKLHAVAIPPDLYLPGNGWTDNEEFGRIRETIGGKYYGFVHVGNPGGTTNRIVRVESLDALRWFNPVGCFGSGLGMDTNTVVTGPAPYYDSGTDRCWLIYSVNYDELWLTYSDNVTGADATAMAWHTPVKISVTGVSAPVNAFILDKGGTGGAFRVFTGGGGGEVYPAPTNTSYGHFYGETNDLSAITFGPLILHFKENDAAGAAAIAKGSALYQFGHNGEGIGPSSRVGFGVGAAQNVNAGGPYNEALVVQQPIISSYSTQSIVQTADPCIIEDVVNGETVTTLYATAREGSFSAIVAARFNGPVEALATPSVRITA